MKKTYSELIEYYENVSSREIIADMYFDYKEEIERLHSIIKEVREKVESSYDNEDSYGDFEIHWELKKELLEILEEENI